MAVDGGRSVDNVGCAEIGQRKYKEIKRGGFDDPFGRAAFSADNLGGLEVRRAVLDGERESVAAEVFYFSGDAVASLDGKVKGLDSVGKDLKPG